MLIWDAHVAQKMLDERPANTLKVKMSDYLKHVCKNWEEIIDFDEEEE